MWESCTLLLSEFSLPLPCSTISDISVLKLKVEKCSRQDTVFMKKVESGFGSSCPYTDLCRNSVLVSPRYNRDLGSHETTKPGDILGKSQWDSSVGLCTPLNLLFAPRNGYSRLCWCPKCSFSKLHIVLF